MNKFLDSTKCLYLPTTYENIKPDRYFTLRANSVFGFIKTDRKKREKIGPLKYTEEREVSIDLVNDVEVTLNKSQKVYIVNKPYFIYDLNDVYCCKLDEDDFYILKSIDV